MTSNDRLRDEIEAFERALATYGADESRWPAGDAERWRALASASPVARALHAEARALDRLLDLVPPPAAARQQALADRILAAAAAQPAASPHAGPRGSADVIVLPRRSPAPAPPRQRPSPVRDWRAAGLMAASLLAGLWVGSSGLLVPLIDGSGLGGDGETLAAVIEQGAGSGLEEVSYE